MPTLRQLAVSVFALALSVPTAIAQPAGFTPPEDIMIEASRTEDGIELSTDNVALTRGECYRLNFACLSSDAGNPAFDVDTTSLVRNAHLRVLTVDAIKVHLQGQSFRALQCEGVGTVKFSFYPMRLGEYQIGVTNEADEAVMTSFNVTVE